MRLMFRALTAVIAMTAVSAAFIGQGTYLIQQNGSTSPNTALDVYAAMLAKSGNDNSVSSSSKSPTATPQPAAPAPRPAPQPAPQPAPVPPAASGPCTFLLGFADLHRTLSGKDGTCTDNEHNDPNGTGDRVQTTVKPDGTLGYMVWRIANNTMAWTDGFRTFTYSKCLLQERLNTQTFVWERNPSLMQQPGETPPPGACDVA
jgi:hypothetical protein